MTSMNGMSGLGGKPIKVSVAVNKIKDGLATPQVPDHISQAVAKSVIGGPRPNGQSHYHDYAGPHRPQGPPPGYHPGHPPPSHPGHGQRPPYPGAPHGGPPHGGNQEYYQYWQQYQQWQQYQHQWYAWQQGQPGASNNASTPHQPKQEDINAAWNSKPEALVAQGSKGILVGRLDQEVEHKQVIDVDKANREFLAPSDEFWTSLADSCWKHVAAY